MSPVGRAFLAGSVGVGVVDEFIDGSHRTVNGFRQFFFIILQQQEALQHIEITPGIPVIHQHTRFIVKGHPPEAVFVHISIENPLLQLMA